MAKATTNDKFVAIKTMKNDVYARREVEILSDLSREPHPNIVRLVDDLQSSTSGGQAPKVKYVALSLARGPTLHHILNKGGALGLVIARTISRQLVSAIAHLHDRNIIHRDIQVRVAQTLCEIARGSTHSYFSDKHQPANIIISGSMINEPLWWADDKDDQGELEIMEKACRLTLIDFGFARELSLGSDRLKSSSTLSNDTALTEALSGGDSDHPLDVSVSYRHVRDLSAVGARFFVAPEVLRGLRERGKSAIDRLSTSIHGSQQHLVMETNGPKKCVSDYGLTADAFSVGKRVVAHLHYVISPPKPYH